MKQTLTQPTIPTGGDSQKASSPVTLAVSKVIGNRDS